MRKILVAGVAVISSLAMSIGVSSLAGAAGTPPVTSVPVTSADLIVPPATPAAGQFSVINNGDGSGGVSMVNGPGSSGSLQLSTTGSGSHWTVFNNDHVGTALSAITSLSYSTYTNNNLLDPILQLEIDPGNTSGTDAGVTYSTLNFEPYLQTPGVVPNTYQNWNVENGVVWGTHLTGAPNAAPLSWSAFLTTYPNASISGGVGVNVGSGWTSPMVGNVGGLTIGTNEGTTNYAFGQLVITTTSLPSGTLNVPYPSTTLTATGGNAPYKWRVSSGALPRGLHLHKKIGTISGTPNKHDATGTYTFTVTAVDAKVKVSQHAPKTQNTSSRQLSITIS